MASSNRTMAARLGASTAPRAAELCTVDSAAFPERGYAASAFADEVTGAPALPPPFPAVARSVDAWRRAGETELVRDREAELEASRPFADFGRVRGGAFALEWKRRRALLCLAKARQGDLALHKPLLKQARREREGSEYAP